MDAGRAPLVKPNQQASRCDDDVEGDRAQAYSPGVLMTLRQIGTRPVLQVAAWIPAPYFSNHAAVGVASLGCVSRYAWGSGSPRDMV
ncbi:hypothetical protein EYF80_036126 [Liparis tanakae]|uniref:Uncharacterized protein n=1 Tax=Liparis tanakae TaxID=230148 RepID=A0A4Z2GK91_9TELE|nr:hypothetical protein EYF80_036126 [Liparis tanakae]